MGKSVRTPSEWLMAIILAAIVVFIAVSVGVAQISHIPTYDELYHLLPALSWRESGTFSLLDGEYTRAKVFTVFVSQLLGTLENEFESARLASVIPGVLAALVLYIWVSRQCGVLAGLLTSLLFSFSQSFVYSVGQIRFYVLHCLLVLLAGIFLYAITRPGCGRIRGFALGIAGLMLILMAAHLQASTLVAVGAMAIWLVYNYRDFVTGLGARNLAILLTLGLAALGVAYALGVVEFVLAHFTNTPLWAANQAKNLQFYIQHLGDSFGFLWSLLPLWLWLGYRQENRRILIFCLVLFTVPLIVHTFAAQKSERYILYAIPWLAAAIGLSISSILVNIKERGTELILCTPLLRRLSPRVAGVASVSCLAVVVLCGVVLEPTLRGVLKSAITTKEETRLANWELVSDELRELSKGRIVVVSEGVKAAYYIGNYDYDLNLSVSLESEAPGDFGIDPRTGRPSIGVLAEVRKVVECYPHVIFILDEKRWRTAHGITDDVASLIEEVSEPHSLGPDANFRVYLMDNPDGARLGAGACDAPLALDP